MYYCGFGIEKNYIKVIELFRKVVNRGNIEVVCNLGCMYEEGDGMKIDYEEVIKWYVKVLE